MMLNLIKLREGSRLRHLPKAESRKNYKFIVTNKKLISANFEQKIFTHFLKRFADFRANFFFSKWAEMKILLCNVAIGNKHHEIYFF